MLCVVVSSGLARGSAAIAAINVRSMINEHVRSSLTSRICIFNMK